MALQYLIFDLMLITITQQGKSMKIVEFLVKLVKIVYFLLLLLSFFLPYIVAVITYPETSVMEFVLFWLIGASFFSINIIIMEGRIDKFLTRKYGKTWPRVLTLTLILTSCLIFFGSVIIIFNNDIHREVGKNNLNTPIAAPKIESPDTSSPSGLPPILSIENIRFSQKVLDADETATLSIDIKNVGRGDARDLIIHLKSDFQGLSFPQITPVPPIPKKIGQQTIDIQVKGKTDLSTGKAKIEIYLYKNRGSAF